MSSDYPITIKSTYPPCGANDRPGLITLIAEAKHPAQIKIHWNGNTYVGDIKPDTLAFNGESNFTLRLCGQMFILTVSFGNKSFMKEYEAIGKLQIKYDFGPKFLPPEQPCTAEYSEAIKNIKDDYQNTKLTL